MDASPTNDWGNRRRILDPLASDHQFPVRLRLQCLMRLRSQDQVNESNALESEQSVGHRAPRAVCQGSTPSRRGVGVAKPFSVMRDKIAY